MAGATLRGDDDVNVLLAAQQSGYINQGMAINGSISDLGLLMATLPLEPRSNKLIYFGFKFGVLHDCITIACCMEGQKLPLKWPWDNDEKVKNYKEQLKLDDENFSDHLLFLKIFDILEEFDPIAHGMSVGEWSDIHGINREVFRLAKIKKGIIEGLLQRSNWMSGYFPFSTSPLDEKNRNMLIKSCILGAFMPVVFVSTRGIGDIDPSLYQWTQETGTRSKKFYDLSTILTYKDVPFGEMEQRRRLRGGGFRHYSARNEEMIQQQVERYFEERGEVIDGVDLAVNSRKLNVVFSRYSLKYLNMALPLYVYHRYQQLKLGNIALTKPILGSDEYKAMGVAVGPHNPLELKFKNMVSQPPTDQVRMDGTSICSVVFDPYYNQYPELNRSRPFLVVGTRLEVQRVGASSSTPAHNVCVSKINTLYHEEVDGLLEVLLLIFGPMVQLYSDPEAPAASPDDFIRKFVKNNNIRRMPSESLLAQFNDVSVGIKSFIVGGGSEEFKIKYKCEYDLTFLDLRQISTVRDYLHTYSLRDSNMRMHAQIIELLSRSRNRVAHI